ncbi:hypothetical protein BHM03_00059763, partial [Ensete ventricosum]
CDGGQFRTLTRSNEFAALDPQGQGQLVDLSSKRGGGATVGEARLGRSAVAVEARLGEMKGATGDLSALESEA